MSEALITTTIESLALLHRGKVRDLYTVDDDHLLMIATDRLSAFDVVLPNPLPGKGVLLTQIAEFWFASMQDIVPNHLTDLVVEDVLTDPAEIAQARGRSMIVKRLDGIPFEAVVRGYLIGSGWVEYQQTQCVCGIALPNGLEIAAKLDEPVFTPATKADVGDHDENVSFEIMAEKTGHDLAAQIRRSSIEIYQRAASHALVRGIIVADTKFEFGLDGNGTLTLMDEILTPDSSRFWEASSWKAGTNPTSFDKQFVRDYLNTLDWDHTSPGPQIPEEVQQKTLARYREALQRLT